MSGGITPIKKLQKTFFVPLTTVATAYSSGQVIGGLTEIKNFFDGPSGVCEVIDCEIFDPAKANSIISVILFSSKPAGTYADSSTFNPSAADLAIIDSVVTIAAANYTSFSANSMASVANIRNMIQATFTPNQFNNQHLNSAWLVLVSGGTPTYGVTTGVAVQLGVEQN